MYYLFPPCINKVSLIQNESEERIPEVIMDYNSTKCSLDYVDKMKEKKPQWPKSISDDQ